MGSMRDGITTEDLPPRGVWECETTDGWTIGYSDRNIFIAVFFTVLGAAWTYFVVRGIVSRPWPAAQAVFALSLCPMFILAAMWWRGGRTEVRVRSGNGEVFAGVGRFGWTRRIDPGVVRRVGMASGFVGGDLTQWIQIEGDRTIKFGWTSSLLFALDRREWVAERLRERLLVGRG